MQHGKRWTYINGCRCSECKAANTDYMRELAQRRREGDYVRTRVDASLAREAIDELLEAGWSLRAIAREVEVTDTTIRRIVNGQDRCDLMLVAALTNL